MKSKSINTSLAQLDLLDEIPVDTNWRTIPEYTNYQVDSQGQVRRLWKHRLPSLLTPYKCKRGEVSKREYVKLTTPAGKGYEVAVINIMSAVWLGGKPYGMVAYHKNGDTSDHCINNIAFTTTKALGKATGAMSRRRPVAKMDPYGQTVGFYPSARAAARENHMSYQTVMDRCNGKVKKPFALDGHNYQWDEGDAQPYNQ